MARPSHLRNGQPGEVAVIDIGPLLEGDESSSEVARQIDSACRKLGFFRITGHRIDPSLLGRMETAAHRFFAQPEAVKREIAMPRGGSARRGWFPVGGEMTSGVPDRKEGLYVGVEHPPEHPRVLDSTPLHGANLFPPGDLGPAVTGCHGRTGQVKRVLISFAIRRPGRVSTQRSS